MEMSTLIDALKLVAKSSATLITWALSVVGGSVAAIVSTSYLRPKNPKVRLIYLLYLPGWLFLGLSVYFGDRVSRHYVASRFVAAHGSDASAYDKVLAIGQKMNADYISQQNMLMLGLLMFGAWLSLFLLWWVFGEWTTNQTE